MTLPTQAQINAGIRYIGGYVVTAGAIIVALGAMPAETANGIVAAAQKVLTDLQQLIGDSYVLVGLVGPVILGLIARFGWKAASPKSQIASVQSLPHAQVLVTDPALKATPEVKVVAQLPH